MFENLSTVIISDLDGLHNSKIGGQMMCDCQETTHMEADQEEDITHVAGILKMGTDILQVSYHT